MVTTIQHVGFVSVIAGFLFISLPQGSNERLTPTETPTPSYAESYRSFNQAVDRHLALHAQLRSDVPGPAAKSSAAEISAASDLLADTIRKARPRARQGDFFDADAARVIRARLGDQVRSSKSTVSVASIGDERGTFRHPRIYLRFPAEAGMATMPSTLLPLLPTLPDELEYRIVGEYLVLRDVKAALILDYLPGAIPRNSRSRP